MKTQFYNKLQNDIYNNSKDLIVNICNELNKDSRSEYLIEKYLDKPSNSKKTGGKVKDPNAPKRNKSAYMFFAESIRAKLRQKYPTDTMGDISKRMGKLWNSLSSRDKKKFEDMSKNDKKRYEKDMIKYKSGQMNISNSETHNNSETFNKNTETFNKNTETHNLPTETLNSKSFYDNSLDLSDTKYDDSSY